MHNDEFGDLKDYTKEAIEAFNKWNTSGPCYSQANRTTALSGFFAAWCYLNNKQKDSYANR